MIWEKSYFSFSCNNKYDDQLYDSMKQHITSLPIDSNHRESNPEITTTEHMDTVESRNQKEKETRIHNQNTT